MDSDATPATILDEGDSYSGDMFDDDAFREYNELLHRTYIAAAMSRDMHDVDGARAKGSRPKRASDDADADALIGKIEFMDRSETAPSGSASTASDDTRAMFMRIRSIADAEHATVVGSAREREEDYDEWVDDSAGSGSEVFAGSGAERCAGWIDVESDGSRAGVSDGSHPVDTSRVPESAFESIEDRTADQ